MQPSATEKRLIRAGLILWVLVAAVLLGQLVYMVAVRSPNYVYRVALLPAMLMAFLLAILALRLRGDQGALIILVAAAFLPISLPTGTASRLVDSLALTMLFGGLWVLRMLAVDRRFHLHPSPVNLPALAFMLVTVAALFWSVIFRDPTVFVWNTFTAVQAAAALVIIMLPVAMLIVANHVQRERTLKWMVALMLLAGVLGFVKDLGLRDLPVNTGGLFAMWVIALAAGLAFFHRGLTRRARALLLLLAGAWIYWGAGVNISWLAGWLPGLVALGVLSLLRSRKLFALLALALLLVIASDPGYYLGTVLRAEANTSLYTRFSAWQVNWQVTRQHLLFGTGPAGYAVYYMSYFPARAMATHSNYLDVLAQTGLVGFGFFIWMVVALVRVGRRTLRRLQGQGGFMEALAAAAFSGLIGSIVIMAFGDWLFPFAYTQGIAGYDYAVYGWLFFGALMALDRLSATAMEARGLEVARGAAG